MREPFRQSAGRVATVSAGAIAFVVAAAWWPAGETATAGSGAMVLLAEHFDDDDLGAAPAGAAPDAMSVIQTGIGSLAGTKSSPSTVLNVVREDIDALGNCLSIGDFDEAPGGVAVHFFPQRSTGGKTIITSFELTRVLSDPSSILSCYAIDNRTTPGTGRLFSLGIYGVEGKLELAGKPVPFSLAEGVAYRVQITLNLTPGTDDSWSVTILNSADPAENYTSPLLRIPVDGYQMSQVSFVAHSDAPSAATIDSIEMIELANGS